MVIILLLKAWDGLPVHVNQTLFVVRMVLYFLLIISTNSTRLIDTVSKYICRENSVCYILEPRLFVCLSARACVNVCAWACACVCVRECVCSSVFVCAYMPLSVLARACARVPVCVSAFACARVPRPCLCARPRVRACVFVEG